MARRRMVDPALFTSMTVAAWPEPVVLTWIGLWCYVDDYGRGEDSPPLVRAAVWPRRPSYTDTKVEKHLALLAGSESICRYQVGGVPLLHIPSWEDWQNPSHRAKSKLPPCPSHDDVLYAEFLRDSGGPLEKYRKLLRRASREAPEALDPNVVQFSSTQSSSTGDAAPATASRGAALARKALSHQLAGKP